MTGGRSKPLFGKDDSDAAPEGAPLGGSRAEAMQRLQVGLFGLGSMVLLIGLAGIIGNQADLTQESAVPEAAPTTEPTEAAPQRDPLADAGIVPDIPAEPSPTPTGASGGEGSAAQPEAAASPSNAPPQP
jgi:hypothetical protein